MDLASIRVVDVHITDVRFHTSKDSFGSDARSKAPDYSVVYVELVAPPLKGVGIAFHLGTGGEMIEMGARLLKRKVIGITIADLQADFGKIWRSVIGADDGSLVWVGPEKGPLHQAGAAYINALWDLWAKAVNKPVWKLVCDMSVDELLRCLDFKDVTDELSVDEARGILTKLADKRSDKIAEYQEKGFPGYTTAAGWLGFTDEEVKAKVDAAYDEGFRAFKMKVGGPLDADLKRATAIRKQIDERGGGQLMMDANCVWDVATAIKHMKVLAVTKPWWIEEPTSPDDVIGHAKIQAALREHGIAVATGEQCSNRVLFKNFLASKGLEVLQTDNCRLAGLNEIIIVMLLACKYHIPVCLHAGGIGLCQMASHVLPIDFVCVTGSTEGRVAEFASYPYLEAMMEHQTPFQKGCYRAPTAAGWGVELKPSAIAEYKYPDGTYWQARPDHFPNAMALNGSSEKRRRVD